MSSFSAWFDARANGLGLTLDDGQRLVLKSFERLGSEIKHSRRARAPWWRMWDSQPRPVRGIYLWGGVGRGKSFLMDGFFEWADVKLKQRVHFHRFMQRIHADLRELQGQEDPMDTVAERVAQEASLLCFDEFQITDIGDAMLMRKLLEGVLDRGVALVTTSNTAPKNLYLHGLQRSQFIPAIELIEQRMDVIHLDTSTDYRQRALERAGTYHYPLGDHARQALGKVYHEATGVRPVADTLDVEYRPIQAVGVAGDVAWFKFSALCDGPRAQADYIELARRYHTILLEGLPRFKAAGDRDRMRRFTWLVDELYDRRVKLMIAAEAPVNEIYAAVEMNSELERTASRLIEMQTHRYLGEPHQVA